MIHLIVMKREEKKILRRNGGMDVMVWKCDVFATHKSGRHTSDASPTRTERVLACKGIPDADILIAYQMQQQFFF